MSATIATIEEEVESAEAMAAVIVVEEPAEEENVDLHNRSQIKINSTEATDTFESCYSQKELNIESNRKGRSKGSPTEVHNSRSEVLPSKHLTKVS
jgi:hypothetical protein